MTTLDPIELIAQSGGDIWESCVSAGMEAKEMLEEGRWTIGDLACLVEKRYGKNNIGEFAKAINYEVARVRDYRRTAKFWKKVGGPAFYKNFPTLNYSHFQAAVGLKDGVTAKAFLQECADNEWTVEKARLVLAIRKGKPVPPPKLLDVEVCIIRIHKSRLEMDVVDTNLEANEALIRAWAQGKPVRIVIQALEPEEEAADAAV